MNFDLTEQQEAVSALAAQILADVDADRVMHTERSDDRFDRRLWADLAESGLLGVAVPEAHGGLGLGMIETALLLREQGRRVAPVPLLTTLVLGAMPIAQFGSPAQQQRWLGAVSAGDAILSGAYAEWGVDDPRDSSVTVTNVDGTWTLTGSKPAVAAAAVADAVLVPARLADGTLRVFVVDTSDPGVEVTLEETTSRELHGTLTFNDLTLREDDCLPADGFAVVDWAVQRARLGIAAIALGCCEEATRMAAEYTSQREQFGRPLSTNQGVAMRAADCYIDLECMHATLLQAAWLIDQQRPAADAVAVAKWWSADAGSRIVHATQHLHGGMGADVDYPVHRYFLWVKQMENTLGGASWQLAELGASLQAATSPARPGRAAP